MFQRNLFTVIENRILQKRQLDDEIIAENPWWERDNGEIITRIFYGGMKTEFEKELEKPGAEHSSNLKEYHRDLFSRNKRSIDEYRGIMFDSPECCVGILEGTTAAVMDFLGELYKDSHGPDAAEQARLEDIKILLYTDDVGRNNFSKTWATRNALDDQLSDDEDKAQDDDDTIETYWIRMIHDSMTKILAIGIKTRDLGPAQTNLFIDSMTAHPDNARLIPKRDLMLGMLACEKIMTLEEFHQIYMVPLDIVFEEDLVHPLVPPAAWQAIQGSNASAPTPSPSNSLTQS